jgi:hypothetical protein
VYFRDAGLAFLPGHPFASILMFIPPGLSWKLLSSTNHFGLPPDFPGSQAFSGVLPGDEVDLLMVGETEGRLNEATPPRGARWENCVDA